MKNIFNLIFLIIGIILFSFYYKYTGQEFNYHIAEFIWYFCQWIIVLFLLNIFSFLINQEKYKKWMLITISYIGISIFLAYRTGDGNGSIFVINGELLTWFLAGLYSIISIIYFIIQHLKNK